MQKLDYKKEYKDLYQPPSKPTIINIPEMLFIAVEGEGDPNTCQEYSEALEILYGLSYTIKMSGKNDIQTDGYFKYVIPPLEGLWYADDIYFDGLNITDKNKFKWIAMIRQPEFVTENVFETAGSILIKKKPRLDLSRTKLKKINEGLCVQIMHYGSYDDEPDSIEKMKSYIALNGYKEDLSDKRLHHEIYLSDPRKCAPERIRTVLRHPIKSI
jgi:hypothetical protein